MLNTSTNYIARPNHPSVRSIAICSGGTGGHMFPACALFDSLKSRGHSVKVITDVRGNRFCDTISQSEKIVLPTLRFSARGIFKLLRDLITVCSHLRSAWKTTHPDLLIGFGSSFTIAPVLIGKLFKSKIILYEQNSVLGNANRFLARFADYKVSTFTIDEKWRWVPSPVRKEFIEAARKIEADLQKGYNCDSRIKIVVIGGSQGALSFSLIIPNALELVDLELRSSIDIVQQVSVNKMKDLQQAYARIGVNARLLSFVYNVAEEISGAQLVIARSGASTLAELSTIGCPAILIPYPLAAGNHQYYNAVCYKNRKAAWIVEEDGDIEKKLALTINDLLRNRQLLKNAASNMRNSLGRGGTEVFSDYVEQVFFGKLSS